MPSFKDSRDFYAVRSAAIDRKFWPKTFALWQASVKGMMERFRWPGVRLLFVEIDPAEFGQWLAATGQINDAVGRMRYAEFVAAALA